MASTYTSALRFEKQGIGENENTWGNILNTQIDLFADAIAGVASIAFGTTAGDITLGTANGQSDEARNAVLVLTGSPASGVGINLANSPKVYAVQNKIQTAVSLRFKGGGGGTALKIPSDFVGWIQTDGTNVRELSRQQDIGAVSAALRDDIVSLRADVSNINAELGASIARTDGDNDFGGNILTGYRASVESTTGPFTLTSLQTGRVIWLENTTSMNINLPSNMPKGWNATLIQAGATVALSVMTSASLVNTSGHTGLNNKFSGAALLVTKQEGANSHAWYFWQGATE